MKKAGNIVLSVTIAFTFLMATMAAQIGTGDGMSLTKQAADLAAAGKYEEAGDAYSKAAIAFKAAGDRNGQATALQNSASMYEKLADSLIKSATKQTPPTLNPAPVPTATEVRPVQLSPMAAVAGHIVGRVVGANGNPLPNFTVEYSGFEDGKQSAISNGTILENVSSKIQGVGGRYSIKVAPGAYRVHAYVTYVFHGRTYNFEAEPLNGPARHDYDHLGLDKLGSGLVRDFELKLTGKRPGASEETESLFHTAYYGGRVELECRQTEGILGGGHLPSTPLRNAFPPASRVQVTLTPAGPMVDGTPGQVIVADQPLSGDGKFTFDIRGIYPGTYTSTARLTTPDGRNVPLRMSLTEAQHILGDATAPDRIVMAWKTSVPVDFLPSEDGARPHFGVQAITLYLGQ